MAGPVEVVDHRRSVQVICAGECVDRDTVSVELDELFDLRSGEPALHRV